MTHSLGRAGLSVTPADSSMDPDAGQGPGIYTAEVRVTDNGVPPPMSSSQSFQITVGEPETWPEGLFGRLVFDDNPAVPPRDPSPRV